MPIIKIDKIDKKILNALQNNARLSNVELSEMVGLSPSPCLARVKALSESGVIKKHVSLLDPEKLNLSINVFIRISLSSQTEDLLDNFESTMLSFPEVLECYLMTGDSDYLLRVATTDVNSFRKFILDKLTPIKGVSSIQSSLALKQVKYETALPI